MYPFILAVTFFFTLLFLLYALGLLRSFYYNRIEAALIREANLLGKLAPVRDIVEGRDVPPHIYATLSDLYGEKYTIIYPASDGIHTYPPSPKNAEAKALTADIRSALAGRNGKTVRNDSKSGGRVLSIAVPVRSGGHVIAAVRLTAPVSSIEAEIIPSAGLAALASFIIAGVLASAITLVFYLRISVPLRKLRAGTDRFAIGDLQTRIPETGSEEIGGLGDALNDMVTQLDDRIKTIMNQRREIEAVLSSMLEGIIAVDMNKRLLNFNYAAAELFSIDISTAHGRPIAEVVANEDLLEFLEATYESQYTSEADIVIEGTGDKDNIYLQAHGTILRDSFGRSAGVVIALNDVSRLRRLENLRRDFVANVSHELKTPITSIKGFVETILDDDSIDPGEIRKFLLIVQKHADRLNAIIDDLLSLSRLDREKPNIEFEDASIADVIESAIGSCVIKAAQKDINIHQQCSASLTGRINPPLLEHAIINLVDNAIKYSEPGGTVAVTAHSTGTEIVISVSDSGCGIDDENLTRVFERFFRVDKARSRKLGGTGLGLAIVKHISQVHGGYPSVESAINRGSTFSIHIPV